MRSQQIAQMKIIVKTMDLTPKTDVVNTDNFYDNQASPSVIIVSIIAGIARSSW